MRREDNILRKTFDFEVDGQRKRGQPKSTWKRHVKEQIKKIGLKEEMLSIVICGRKPHSSQNNRVSGHLHKWG